MLIGFYGLLLITRDLMLLILLNGSRFYESFFMAIINNKFSIC